MGTIILYQLPWNLKKNLILNSFLCTVGILKIIYEQMRLKVCVLDYIFMTGVIML